MHLSLSLALALALTWWLLSGQTQPLLLAFGAVSVLLSLWLSQRLGAIVPDAHPLRMAVGLLRFWAGLLRDIVVSNIQVARLVFSPRPAIDPQLVRVRTALRGDLGRVVLANAITLTPGTVTIDVEGSELVVHALTAAGAEDLLAGSIDARIPRDAEPPA